jgi:hypothetical protein
MSKNRYIYCTLDANFVPDNIKTITDLFECVNGFSNLPNLVLAKLQVFPGSDEEKQLIEGVKEIYSWTERWLSYYLLSSENKEKQDQIKSQLLSTDGKHFQSYAEVSVALYRLCEEAHRYPGWAKQFDSPAALWFSCEYERCWLGLENSGLIGVPLPMSKREYAANTAKFWGKQGKGDIEETLGLFGNPEQRETYPKDKPESGVATKLASPFYMLILTASYLAKVDTKFREGAYRNWMKADKRHSRTILNDRHLHSVFLTGSGNLITTQSTVNMPGSRLEKRRNKGFGKHK